MTERENVIKGLEESYQAYLVIEGRGVLVDSDENEYALIAPVLMRDAIALLKSQEPRVMTLEEYDAWTDIPFTERDPVFHEERTKRGSVTCWVNTGVCSLREYGKNDRCWTSRPDQATMEATPWQL